MINNERSLLVSRLSLGQAGQRCPFTTSFRKGTFDHD